MQEQSIFIEALEKTDPAERAGLLDRLCAHDPALRRRIDKLLERHEQADGFLEAPAISMPAAAEVMREGPGTVIGPYKLLEQIGEGGFGLVFMAEQQQPVRRKVAIKVLKPGMDTRQVIARFEAERQALALMDHPNIAHVLEAGETSSGRPYFAMELVRGVPITDYCDKSSLTLRERLELFLTVCQAVQHAHQKGIIHRDLKPSNIMVTLHDDVPVVKVIDFGIAKALGQQLTERTLYTGFAQLIGTPLYMSPEQAEMSGLDVDTRSDIYSLGVLLYELLIGTTPFDRERLNQAGYDEMRRIIREEDPAKPSTRLSTMGAAATAVSARRQSDPRGLSRMFRGELDWLAMKALDKDRNRRYETANGLAADVQRYLNDEPVSACPPSAWYRLGKFGRRHRWGLALSAVVAAALVVLVAGSLIWAVFLNDALQESEGQRRRAEGAEKTAVVAEKAARERLYASLRAQAHASRFSQRMGQRFKSLEALAEAAKIARDLTRDPDTAAADALDLRNEAIASLALLDLRVAKEWDGWPDGSMTLGFDGAMERYARVDRQGVVHIHRVADGSEIRSLPGFGPGDFGGGEAYPCFSPDGRFLLLARGRAIKVWTLSGQEPVPIPLPSSDYTGYAFSPDSREIALVQANGSIQLHDLVSGRQLKQLPGVANSRRAAFHPRFRQLAVGHALGVHIRDLETGEVLADLKQPANEHIAWHPNGTVLAIVGADDMIHLWDMATRQPVTRLERRGSGGFGFAFNHAGDLLAGIGFDGILYLWETHTGRQLFSTQATSAGLPRFSPDDQLLAAGVDLDRHKLRLWQLPSPVGYRRLGRGHGVCAVSPKERLLAVGAGTGIALWDLTTSAQVDFLEVGWSCVLFEPSGALLASGRGDGVRRWPIERDPAKPRLLRIGPPQKLPLPDRHAAIAMSDDGRVLASPGLGVPGGRGLVWHRDQPGPMVSLPLQFDSRTVAVSRHGEWVATGSWWGTKVQISDARTGEPVRELPVDGTSRVRFSPDGRWLATTGGGCRLWEVGSWRLGRHIGGEILAFSPDGKLLAVESGHGAVRLVNPDTGREYARLEDPGPGQARADDLCFTSDGSALVVSSGDSGSIQVWDLRIIRQQLAEIHLDWETPAAPPAVRHHDRVPLRAEVDVGPEFALARFETLVRAGKYDEIVRLADVAASLPPVGWKESHQAVKMLERGLRAVHDDARLLEAQRRTRCRLFLERTRTQALEALKRGAPAVAGVLEAETLPVLNWQGCRPVVQYIFDYAWGANWSNGMQLMGDGMKKDGFIEVEVAAPREGRYRLLVQFCQSYDYGIVEIHLDGSKIGKPFDGHATAVVLAGEREIAVVELSQGKHRLRFTAVDKNEKSRGYQLGMDYLKLQPVR